MSDLIKCKGDGCLLAYRCRRFTAYLADNSPPFFADAPYRIVESVLKCDMFWGDSEESIFNQLKEIVDDKAGENKRTDE